MPEPKREGMPEKRRFVRVSGAFVVSYTEEYGPKAADISQTKNISIGGLLFTTHRGFLPDAILSLKIRIPETLEYINLKAKVIESVQIIKDLMYDTRVAFIQVGDEDKVAISKTVEYLLKKEREEKGG